MTLPGKSNSLEDKEARLSFSTFLHSFRRAVYEGQKDIKIWEEWFTSEVVQRLKKAIRKVDCDYEHLSGGVKGHKQRFETGEKGEVRFGIEDYSEVVEHVIEACFSLSIDREGKPHVMGPKQLHESNYGFDAKRIVEEAKRIKWENEQLIFSLEWRFKD